jgi:disulfide bond formation protein DsbB
MLTIRNATLLLLIASLTTLAGAWAFQVAGYDPCHLCLLQRWPHYALIVIAAASLIFLQPRMQGIALKLLGVLMVGSAIFGAYHAGVEWGFWPGPSTCTATGALSGALPDLTKPVVMCDQAALRILGTSLAGWNAVISFALALLAFATKPAYGSSSVSQYR